MAYNSLLVLLCLVILEPTTITSDLFGLTSEHPCDPSEYYAQDIAKCILRKSMLPGRIESIQEPGDLCSTTAIMLECLQLRGCHSFLMESTLKVYTDLKCHLKKTNSDIKGPLFNIRSMGVNFPCDINSEKFNQEYSACYRKNHEEILGALDIFTDEYYCKFYKSDLECYKALNCYTPKLELILRLNLIKSDIDCEGLLGVSEEEELEENEEEFKANEEDDFDEIENFLGNSLFRISDLIKRTTDDSCNEEQIKIKFDKCIDPIIGALHRNAMMSTVSPDWKCEFLKATILCVEKTKCKSLVRLFKRTSAKKFALEHNCDLSNEVN